MTEDKLRFTTLAFRRVMASEYDELSPIAKPQLLAYGSEDRTRTELALVLSEVPEEGKPATVARLLLPEGVRLEHVEIKAERTELTGRLGRAQPHGERARRDATVRIAAKSEAGDIRV
jgi:hypothetical protein